MIGFLSVILMILGILLIIVVLLQPGKGDMISGMGGLGGQFSSMLGTRRAMDLLTKITIGFAATIMVLSLVTNLFFVGEGEDIQRPAVEGAEVPINQPVNPLNRQTPPAQQGGGQQQQQPQQQPAQQPQQQQQQQDGGQQQGK